MFKGIALIPTVIFILSMMPSPTVAAERFTVLSYHDIHDVDAKRNDIISLSSETLIGHFAWLREHDYHVVSLDRIVAAREGLTPLPDKAILLTFDDGYRSIYTSPAEIVQLPCGDRACQLLDRDRDWGACRLWRSHLAPLQAADMGADQGNGRLRSRRGGLPQP